ncbi:Uncharacterised protein [Mycobacteroides abscessus subsp. abscessus]|nr:Uncharacterised protein [Mycobacteroides abscessus subsp. abscessus]
MKVSTARVSKSSPSAANSVTTRITDSSTSWYTARTKSSRSPNSS